MNGSLIFQLGLELLGGVHLLFEGADLVVELLAFEEKFLGLDNKSFETGPGSDSLDYFGDFIAGESDSATDLGSSVPELLELTIEVGGSDRLFFTAENSGSFGIHN